MQNLRRRRKRRKYSKNPVPKDKSNVVMKEQMVLKDLLVFLFSVGLKCKQWRMSVEVRVADWLEKVLVRSGGAGPSRWVGEPAGRSVVGWQGDAEGTRDPGDTAFE